MTEAPAPPRTPQEAVAAMRIHAPSERSPKLAGLLDAANASAQLKARWHAAQVTAERLGMSDHSWVHLQIVLNSALRLYRLLRRRGVQSAIEADYGLGAADAEVVIAAGCLLHDLGMSVHRVDHEAYSLFLAADHLDDLLERVYAEPERTIVASEALHAIIGHRKGGTPLTLEAGIVRVADALDMEHGRSRVSLETHLPNIHSISAAAIDKVNIVPGDQRTIRLEIEMNNSAGVFQVDELLATKLRGPGSRTTSKWWRGSRPSTRSGCCRCTGSDLYTAAPHGLATRTGLRPRLRRGPREGLLHREDRLQRRPRSPGH